MNPQLNRLAVVAVLLLVALVVGTTYWQAWAAGDLADKQDNAIQRVAEFQIRRGRISMGPAHVPLAVNRRIRVRGETFYQRRYPHDGLLAQTVGYSTLLGTQAGLERSLNDYLTGANASLNTILDKLKGATVRGNSLQLTIDPVAQKVAMNALAGRCGAVAAVEPSTGKALVLASSPTFDQNKAGSPLYLRQLSRQRAQCGLAAPLLNRTTDGLFTPGSTFKIITASAALDSGKFTPESQFYDPGYCVEYGKQVSNAGNPDQNGPEQFGNVSLVTGFEHSINSVFCNIGKAIGAGRILDTAKRFGFYERPPLETPADTRAPSGLYKNGKLYDPSHPEFQVDPGRLAFGQERLQVTPLQMAMVAAGIANRGVVMKPYVVDRIVAPGGSTVSTTHPDRLHRAVSPKTAEEVGQMMVAAVQGGTGTAAQIPGIQVAGKTGTAETGVQGTNTTWFVAFAPADHPKVAVAVVLEKQHGFGGTIAAPVAKQVIEAVLRKR
ncbi:MAG TPA: penicillin-binding protein 2 [Gaiellaceae bacterium]